MNHPHTCVLPLARSAVPANYKILCMAGGGMGQFAAVPLNLLGGDSTGGADFIVTGAWSKKAAQEATKYGAARVAATSERAGGRFDSLPAQPYAIAADAAYVHYCANETVHGLEFPFVPDAPAHVPLVADFSSSFMSAPIDVARFGLIYAGAQKNVGPAGVTIVIVRDDLLAKAPQRACPSVLDYAQTAANQSMLNTPPCFSIYVVGLVAKWLRAQGGLAAIAAANRAKAALLYDYIDSAECAGFYACAIAERAHRSLMNVVFRIASPSGGGSGFDEALEKRFVQEATSRRLVNLAGHRSVGGLRASIYNAMPAAGVEALVAYMREFRARTLGA